MLKDDRQILFGQRAVAVAIAREQLIRGWCRLTRCDLMKQIRIYGIDDTVAVNIPTGNRSRLRHFLECRLACAKRVHVTGSFDTHRECADSAERAEADDLKRACSKEWVFLWHIEPV